MKCGTRTCEADAVFRVFWPAQTIDLCTPCTERARRIAQALDFEVETAVIIIGAPAQGSGAA